MSCADSTEKRVRDYPHRRFPIQELVKNLKITQQGRYGLFDIIVNYLPTAHDLRFEDIPVEVTNVSYGFATPWTITLSNVNPATIQL